MNRSTPESGLMIGVASFLITALALAGRAGLMV
jgi:hypothetical protein